VSADATTLLLLLGVSEVRDSLLFIVVDIEL
jgi:hypothetical protein